MMPYSMRNPKMHIALVRHGEPAGADNPVVSASGFARWARRYERSRLKSGSVPPNALGASFEHYLAISSGLPRSLHSAEVCLGRGPDLTMADLKEMEIPRYRIPLRMPAYGWLLINRAIWMAGVRGRFESFSDAKARARNASFQLHRLAHAHSGVVVFGHAIMNRRVAEHLVNLGWEGHPRQTGYWEVIDLRKPATGG